jgi:hypothetical protein
VIGLTLGLALGLAAWALRWSEGERRALRDELADVDRQADALVHSGYSHPIARAFFERRVFRSLVVWGVLAALAWLDSDGCVTAQHASIFGAIIGIFEAIGEFFGFVGGAVATSLAPVVGWLVSTVGWLWGVVKNFIVGTGAVFARAWAGLTTLWSDVLKPAFVWLDQAITRLHTWLKETLQPVFDFLRRVRDVVQALYNTFVKPILATIDFIRQLDRVLQVFHINLLRGLDAVLTRVEQRIDGVVLWIYGRLNDVLNALNTIVGLDGFFQRYMFLKTAERDAAYLVRLMWNAQLGTMFTPAPGLRTAGKLSRIPPEQFGRDLGEFYETGGGPYAGKVAELVPIWERAAGLDVTAPDQTI